jgi:hypothetical protein
MAMANENYGDKPITPSIAPMFQKNRNVFSGWQSILAAAYPLARMAAIKADGNVPFPTPRNEMQAL